MPQESIEKNKNNKESKDNKICFEYLEQGKIDKVLDYLGSNPNCVNQIDKKTNLTLIEFSIKKGYENLVFKLLEINQFDLNIQGHNPLRMAIEHGFTNLAEKMLSLNANVNDYEEGKDSILKLALDSEYFSLASKIIDKGAEINARDSRGWTLLIWAAFHGRLNIIDFLLTRVSQIKNLIKPRYTLVLMLFKNLY